MNEQEAFRDRIPFINEYIELGQRLEQVIDEPEICKKVTELLGDLQYFRARYERLSEGPKARIDLREAFADEYWREYGSRKRAKEQMDASFRELAKDALSNLVRAYICRAWKLCARPFSKTLSRLIGKAQKRYENRARSNVDVMRYQRRKVEHLQRVHEAEFTEASAQQSLKQYLECDDKTIDALVEHPEVLVFVIFDSLRERYAPWL